MEKTELSDKLANALRDTALFRNLPENIRRGFLEELEYSVNVYAKNEVIVEQGSPCRYLMVLLRGAARSVLLEPSGKEVIVYFISRPMAMSLPQLFNTRDNNLPYSYQATEASTAVLFATRESVLAALGRYPDVQQAFLAAAAEVPACASMRLHVLSHRSIRDRFTAYLFAQSRHSAVSLDLVYMPHNQAQLANYLNVARQALSREISRMVAEGLIEVKGRHVRLLRGSNPDAYLSDNL